MSPDNKEPIMLPKWGMLFTYGKADVIRMLQWVKDGIGWLGKNGRIGCRKLNKCFDKLLLLLF